MELQSRFCVYFATGCGKIAQQSAIEQQATAETAVCYSMRGMTKPWKY